MFSARFARETAERSVKSTAQALVLVFAADKFDALQADWRTALGAALGAFLLSVATSVASARLGPDPDSPSVV